MDSVHTDQLDRTSEQTQTPAHARRGGTAGTNVFLGKDKRCVCALLAFATEPTGGNASVQSGGWSVEGRNHVVARLVA